MKIATSILFLLLLSLSALGQDVSVQQVKRGCIGRILYFLEEDTHYVTYSNLDHELPESIAQVLPPKISQSYFSDKLRLFSRKLITPKAPADPSLKPIESLREGELYTFAITDDEIRFGAASKKKNPLSPKNFMSKHPELARSKEDKKKKENLHYAGEAWLVNGVLVINHDSGTYQPSAEFLSDVARYMQQNLKVDKVLFTDELGAGQGSTVQTPTGLREKIVNLVKVRLDSITEGYVNFVSSNKYEGQTVSIGADGNPGTDLVMKVEGFIGSGMNGVVYRMKIVKVSEAGKRAFPGILENGVPRTDLVIKFPHNVPYINLLGLTDNYTTSIRREREEYELLKNLVADFDQKESAILATGELGKKSFLVKPFVKAKSIGSLAKTMTSLSPEQIAALDRDIYQMALHVKEKSGLILDIKAENIGWDAENKRWVMFELSTRNVDMYTQNGFDAYLTYFVQRMKLMRPKPWKKTSLLLEQRSEPSLVVSELWRSNEGPQELYVLRP